MAYYEDLTPCRYFDDFGNFGHKFVAIGWIHDERNFTKGDIEEVSKGLFENDWKFNHAISALQYAAESTFNYFAYLGGHICMMCPPIEDNKIQGFYSYRNIFLPDVKNDVVYCFPESLHHYIAVHGYVPPRQFMECLARHTSNTNRLHESEKYWDEIKQIIPRLYEECRRIRFDYTESQIKYYFGTKVYPEFIQHLQSTLEKESKKELHEPGS